MRYLQKLFFPVCMLLAEAVVQTCSVKIKALAPMFSCEFCEISKNTFSCRTPPVAASVLVQLASMNVFYSV